MEKFLNLKSIPSYLPLQNIDTDMIIPKQFLKTIKRTGLGKSLFYEMRYDTDTARQVRMYFPDLDSAISYAASHNIDYVVQQPKSRRVQPKAYADNFAFSRNGAWTH